MTLRRCAAAVLMAVAAACAGCAGGTIQGRVIGGSAGVVQVVATGSDRPEQSGVAGADVELRAVGRGQSGPTIGMAKSGPDGRFSVRYSDRRMVRDRLQLFAKANGYIPVQEEFFLPGTGRIVLVVMKQTAPGTPPPPAVKPRE